jgi:hypothetical protein
MGWTWGKVSWFRLVVHGVAHPPLPSSPRRDVWLHVVADVRVLVLGRDVWLHVVADDPFGAVWVLASGGTRLQPAGLAEGPVQADFDDGKDSENDEVCRAVAELRHVVEVHPVDAGDHGRHRSHRDPG